jgi:hypothetical protein
MSGTCATHRPKHSFPSQELPNRSTTNKIAAEKPSIEDVPAKDMIKDIEDDRMKTTTWIHPKFRSRLPNVLV